MPTNDALDRRLHRAAETSRDRSYGECRGCGRDLRDTAPVVLTVGIERAKSAETTRYRVAQRGRTYCGRCAVEIAKRLIAVLEGGVDA